MALEKFQHCRVTFDIMTRASEPLVLDDHTLGLLRDAFEAEVSATVDLRYYPESRYAEERHQLLGVDIATDGGRSTDPQTGD